LDGCGPGKEKGPDSAPKKQEIEMDTRDVIARLERDIASLRRQNQRARVSLVAVALVALTPWLIAATTQAGSQAADNLTVGRIHLDGPNGGVTLRSIAAVSTIGADNNRPAPALGIFAGTSDTLAASVVAGRSGTEFRVGDPGGVRLSGGSAARGRVEVVNEEGKTGAELLAAPSGGGSLVVRGPTGVGVAVVETATDGSGQVEVRDAAGRIIQRLP
jgi:hypothetical protein